MVRDQRRRSEVRFPLGLLNWYLQQRTFENLRVDPSMRRASRRYLPACTYIAMAAREYFTLAYGHTSDMYRRIVTWTSVHQYLAFSYV
jgi:hypothetical protein